MGFPANPVNGQIAIVNNIQYSYSAVNNSWFKTTGSIPVRVDLKTAKLTVAGDAALNGISANGSLGLAGHVLTSNGSDTYWAPVTDISLDPILNELNEVINLDINAIFNSALQP